MCVTADLCSVYSLTAPSLWFVLCTRMPCDTTWACTSVLCAWRMWKAPCGRWMRWSTRGEDPRRSQGTVHKPPVGHSSIIRVSVCILVTKDITSKTLNDITLSRVSCLCCSKTFVLSLSWASRITVNHLQVKCNLVQINPGTVYYHFKIGYIKRMNECFNLPYWLASIKMNFKSCTDSM